LNFFWNQSAKQFTIRLSKSSPPINERTTKSMKKEIEEQMEDVIKRGRNRKGKLSPKNRESGGGVIEDFAYFHPDARDDMCPDRLRP
jgi:hypothetical protein